MMQRLARQASPTNRTHPRATIAVGQHLQARADRARGRAAARVCQLLPSARRPQWNRRPRRCARRARTTRTPARPRPRDQPVSIAPQAKRKNDLALAPAARAAPRRGTMLGPRPRCECRTSAARRPGSRPGAWPACSPPPDKRLGTTVGMQAVRTTTAQRHARSRLPGRPGSHRYPSRDHGSPGHRAQARPFEQRRAGARAWPAASRSTCAAIGQEARVEARRARARRVALLVPAIRLGAAEEGARPSHRVREPSRQLRATGPARASGSGSPAQQRDVRGRRAPCSAIDCAATLGETRAGRRLRAAPPRAAASTWAQRTDSVRISNASAWPGAPRSTRRARSSRAPPSWKRGVVQRLDPLHGERSSLRGKPHRRRPRASSQRDRESSAGRARPRNDDAHVLVLARDKVRAAAGTGIAAKRSERTGAARA